ncbi:AAA family ATPase [Pseudonocardia ailaonensis]|uniref:AAA family ATPase n=1 Tax=Pseudonocardia ailaonensis TaxID=367279 RepID=A0ABN2NE32_9PSEU
MAGLRGRTLELGPGVTFLVGENGSGKSTLVEAVATAAGFNAEGGSRNFRFATRASESALGEALTLVRAPGKERSTFFLRAETFYNVATEIENLGIELDAYGGVSPHERSHGQSFLDLLTHRFHPRGLYLLDEPEAALSTQGQLAALARIDELTRAGSQFLIATHSPILLALPGARILEIDDGGGLHTVPYDDALPVRAYRGFLADPERMLRNLLG